jgi:septum formation protein
MRGMLILASASPRRQQLLRWLCFDYVVDAPDVDERVRPGEIATELVSRLSRSKAMTVAVRRPNCWILAADTVVEVGGDILGKPADAAEAAAMLGRLAGKEHRVCTAFTLLGPDGAVHADEVVLTRVRFRALGPAAIAAYVASGEGEGKAGSYAIQGLGAGLVASVEGSFTNVIGLPLTEVAQAFARAGLLVS